MFQPNVNFRSVIERIFYVIGGVIIAIVLPEKMEDILSLNENILRLAIIVTLLIAVYLFADARRKIEHLADKMETTVEFVEETYRSQKEINYKGKPFEKLIEWVNEAENEILVLTGPTAVQGIIPPTFEHEKKITYLNAIEKKVKKYSNKPFKYVRIQQMTQNQFVVHPNQFLSPSTIKHYKTIITFANRQTSTSPIILGIMKILTQRATNYMIIDRKRLVLEYDEVDQSGTTILAGFFFIEDRIGKITDHFVRYFSNLERQATEFDLKDFETNESTDTQE